MMPQVVFCQSRWFPSMWRRGRAGPLWPSPANLLRRIPLGSIPNGAAGAQPAARHGQPLVRSDGPFKSPFNQVGFLGLFAPAPVFARRKACCRFALRRPENAAEARCGLKRAFARRTRQAFPDRFSRTRQAFAARSRKKLQKKKYY